MKTQEDLGKLTGFMNKLVIETALNEEMAQHLGHEKHQKKRGSNTRNGYSKKTVISDDGVPRDRESSFEPHFEEIWDDKHPYIGQFWRRHWENLSTFFVYPKDICKVIYTTNAIESLNSVIRHAIKKRKVFPTDDSVKKLIYLAIQQASKKMDNAYPKPKKCDDSIYYRIWWQNDSSPLTGK